MSLSSETMRVAAEFEAAQAARLAAIAGIGATVQRDMRQDRASLKRTMAEYARTMDKELKGIFSEVALIRGAAKDLIEWFASEREENTEAMRAELESLTSKLEKSVSAELSEMVTAREEVARRESTARRAYLRDLRRRVGAVLGDASKYIADLNHDRMRAERVWLQHLRTQRKRRHEAAKQAHADAKPAPRPRASAAKGKRKKKAA